MREQFAGARRVAKPGAVALLCCGCLLSAHPAGAAWFGRLEAAAVHDDNLSRSELENDVESDSGLRVFADGGHAFELENGNSVALSASAQYTAHDEFDGMDNLAAGVAAAWRKKFGLGNLAPVLRLRVGAERQEFDARNRDGWTYRGEVSLGRRLSERWEVAAAAAYDARRADEARLASSATGPGPDLVLVLDPGRGRDLGLGRGRDPGTTPSRATSSTRTG